MDSGGFSLLSLQPPPLGVRRRILDLHLPVPDLQLPVLDSQPPILDPRRLIPGLRLRALDPQPLPHGVQRRILDPLPRAHDPEPPVHGLVSPARSLASRNGSAVSSVTSWPRARSARPMPMNGCTSPLEPTGVRMK